MLRPALISIATLITLPASAQDARSYDPEILPACLAQRQGDDRMACIGLAADACSDSSTAGMVQCLSAEAADWDARLNDAYQVLLTDARQADTEARDLGSTAASMEKTLREMQRSWITFRDASCAYAAAQFQGGTAAGPAVADCAMQLTARQAILLMRHAGDVE
ncbi:MAG: lysozyme inhibitor LprI family protein [Paracoccus sp. (in: a-proteobacteria)]|uniref:lysozyme inhibitor LprI family protein n=1 Tax=Paracoccus sp. TaxID=267 RepID=UPI0026DEA1E3|nr:lysozyme inhibitor LprI family protein [Paracoccus sp. (in: a-proteobacteria)]MDO5631433.1 lysozyme inhibitor LprI family protein [Paracoccus sp. (in: a-proteobacteria)]